MWRVVDSVLVVLFFDREARVEIPGHLKARLYPYVGREPSVQRIADLIGGYPAFGIEVRYLRGGVYSAVCPAGSVQNGALAYKLFKGVVYHLLNGNTVGLDLPAYVIRSVVFDYKRDPSHFIRWGREFLWKCFQ